MSYKEDLFIDKYNLDEAWENQALLYCEWAEKAVEATFERDKAKENLEVVRAKIDAEIRKSAVDEGSKITENAINNSIIMDKRYRDANQKVIDNVKALGLLNVAKESFEHRKKALEKLTELFLSGFYAEPRESKTIRKGRAEQEEKTREEQYKKLGENKRIARRKES